MGNDLANGVVTLGNDRGHGAGGFGRHHDLVQHNGSLLHGADDVAAADLVAGLCHRDKVPQLIGVQGGHFHAAGQVGAGLFHDLLQRTLDAVVDILDQTGAKLHAQGSAGGFHRGAGSQAGGLLIDLDGGPAAGHGQDLADQALVAHAHHIGHIGVLQTLGDDQRAGNFYNGSAHAKTPFT